MKYVFIITYILYIFFKTLYITNSKKNTEIDVIYLLFYLIELFWGTNIYLIFSLLNIVFIIHYNKGGLKKFTKVFYQTILIYILILPFNLPIIGYIILSLCDKFIITIFKKINRKIDILRLKKKIKNLILIKTNCKEELKYFLNFRHDVIFIEDEQNIYKEFNKKNDKFTKIIVSNNEKLNIKNIINFGNGFVNDVLIQENNGNYDIKSIKYSNNKSVITYAYENKNYILTTDLISYDENKMALSLYALGKYLKLTDYDIRRGLNNLKPTKIKIIQNEDGTLISNTKCYSCYNHYEGLDLISNYKGKKVIVTGGIKNADDNVNKAYGSLLAREFSYIILLNTNNMPLIYEMLMENNYDKNKIYIIEKLDEYKGIVDILKSKKTYILLDSDI